MNFEDFAQSHGLIIKHIIYDRWIPTPTVDHPKSSNGRYKFLGDVGWVQNWATMDKPSMWRTDKVISQPRRQIQIAKDTREQDAQKAVARAKAIMAESELETHPYLASKGFPEEKMLVCIDNWESKLVIPMYGKNGIQGVQMVDDKGGKKFLYGQRTKGAFFCMDAKGVPIFCEGFATGLSVRSAMEANKFRYSIYVCFSATNMKEVARTVGKGIVIADNDPNQTGESVAKVTGYPYWISDTVGEDFNDYHIRVGLFKASQSLKKIVGSLASSYG